MRFSSGLRDLTVRRDSAETDATSVVSLVFLCLPTGLHLHPNLQLKVLDYMRVLTANQSAQVIVATHIPTIVEAPISTNFFFCVPVEFVNPGENQQIPIAHDGDLL